MYVAPYVEAQVEEIEMFVVNELVTEPRVIDPHKDRVQIVKKEDNVGGLMRMYDFNKGHVVSLLIFLKPSMYRSYNFFSY